MHQERTPDFHDYRRVGTRRTLSCSLCRKGGVTSFFLWIVAVLCESFHISLIVHFRLLISTGKNGIEVALLICYANINLRRHDGAALPTVFPCHHSHLTTPRLFFARALRARRISCAWLLEE